MVALLIKISHQLFLMPHNLCCKFLTVLKRYNFLQKDEMVVSKNEKNRKEKLKREIF